MPIYAVRSTTDGAALLLNNSKLQELTLKRIAILSVAASSIEWHSLRELMNAFVDHYESFKNGPLALQFKDADLNIDDILWLEKRNLINVARYKDENGNLAIAKPSSSWRRISNSPIPTNKMTKIALTQLGYSKIESTTLTNRQRVILNIARTPTPMHVAFRETRKARKAAIDEVALAMDIVDLQNKGYIKVYK